MIKVIVATGFSCLAIGSAAGYCISESTRQPTAIAQNPQTTTSPKLLTRSELERRFIACIGKPMRLKAFTDKDLNDSLAECEALKAKS